MTAPAATAGAMTAPGGVVYEVNLDVEAGIRGPYLAWLADHVAEIRALPGFAGARRFEVTDPAPLPGRVSLCVQYTLVDQAALDAYLRDHAPRLRADGQARFGGRFTASRRVLAALA
ncbi:DUF4286 family protein [Agrilutibacter solisilvae]|uniref:DUF4286 family protein n=1 Tax=Agrilutibacter solisilvae TaxID=2763317 RepID=A0A975ATJ5_9GAMM|nr:DUF4286 family protein [Lysobacter solisilvae]QSX79358.1 DUF4286 family protein [Lysobacter solisilvae]